MHCIRLLWCLCLEWGACAPNGVPVPRMGYLRLKYKQLSEEPEGRLWFYISYAEQPHVGHGEALTDEIVDPEHRICGVPGDAVHFNAEL